MGCSFRKQTVGVSEAEKIARAADPKVWDGMTKAERREMVAKVYEHAGRMLNALDLLRRTGQSRRHRTYPAIGGPTLDRLPTPALTSGAGGEPTPQAKEKSPAEPRPASLSK
jgi:hypothetical protein